MNLRANSDSSEYHNIQFKPINYYGKGICLLRFSIEFDHTGKLNHNTWNLIDIENESKIK